eukprot:552649-Pyramimonas_sp.AAC.1
MFSFETGVAGVDAYPCRYRHGRKKITLPLRAGGRVPPMGSWGSWGTPWPSGGPAKKEVALLTIRNGCCGVHPCRRPRGVVLPGGEGAAAPAAPLPIGAGG